VLDVAEFVLNVSKRHFKENIFYREL